jgi:energy-coupling factor transporter ATP-binding protein EcfA2
MIKVFLSSTSKDLEPYRQRAEKAINSIDGYHCVAMENFGARDSSAEVFCHENVEECDLFVLLLGPTYGSCPPGSDKSYTQLEYEAAVNKPRLIFASSKQFQLSQELINSIDPDQFRKQKNFRALVSADRIWGEFVTEDQLDALISRAVQNWKPENGKDTLAKYLAHLIERNTYLNPRGVMQTQRQVSLKLDEVYVSLKAEKRTECGLTGRMRVVKPGDPWRSIIEDEIDEWRGLGGHTTRELLSLDSNSEHVELSAAVREHSRIVILGDPGAGKTTLLHFLALQFAQAYREGKTAVRSKDGAEYGETRLPIFLRVADYAEVIAKNRNLRLAEFLAAPFKDIAPEPAIAALFNDAFRRGQAFVMLDGLDEVIDASDRALIARRIEDFVTGLEYGNRVIITSRIAGYREAPLSGDCQHFTLLDLERDQIEQFLCNWCHETERFLAKDASEEELTRNAQREINSILSAVDNNPGVKRLAVNPLLLTILALIHRNGSRLPNRRVELYDLAAKTLLETWQIERMNVGKFNIREGEAAEFLWPLAYWLHSEKPRGMATEQEVKYKLAEFLAATRKQESDHPEIIAAADDFLRRVRHHTGLLVERAPNRYGFMHLTFEEYFAARELVRRPDRVAKARWMMAITASPGQFTIHDSFGTLG